MSVVFVSYAHVDEDRVRELVAKLKESQVAVWWDKDIPPGADWEALLDAKMQEAEKVLIVCSTESIHRDEVRFEARYAIKTKKALPVRIEDVELPFRWTGYQFVDLLGRPVEASPQWSKLLDVARGHGSVKMSNDEADAFALQTRGDGGVALSWETTIPAVLVALSLLTSVVGDRVFPTGGQSPPWTLIVAITLGALAFAAAIWAVAPRRSL